MSIRVTVADRVFNDETAHVDPIRWSLDIEAGWDAPESDVDLLPTIGEGSALGRVMLRHRTIVCSGHVVASTSELHWQAWLAMENLVPVYEQVPFVVHEPAGPRYVMVSAAPGSPRLRSRDGLSFEFQLTLVATDPHKRPYEETP